MEITCYRDTEIGREPRRMPAAVYNLTRTLLSRSESGVVFVPIRNMQYLAILDSEELVFLDHHHKTWIEISWQNFSPKSRTSLEDSVPYDAVFYGKFSRELMSRLLGEFPKALQQIHAKHANQGSAKILKFEKRRTKD